MPLVTMYVPDQYKTYKMCDKVVLENGGISRFILECYKNKKMCDKAVDNYSHTLEFFPKCCKTQKMCDKAVDTCPFAFDSAPDWYNTQEGMLDKTVSNFLLKYCLNRYKTWEVFDKAVDASLPALKFVPDWFVTNKMLEKIDNIAFSDDDIGFDDIESDIFTFFSDGMGLFTIDFNNCV